MKKIRSYFGTLFKQAKIHKFISTLIIIILLIAAYYIYHSISAGNTLPQYTLMPVRTGSIIQTVTGTGQVSASNQTDIQSQVSGTIETINVAVGQMVKKDQIIATIDSTNAQISLQNAKISLAKLTEPPKTTDVSNAQNNVSKAYNDAFSSAASTYLDLPNIMAGMKDLLYGQNGFLSDQKSSYLTTTARNYRDSAGSLYDKAVAQYAISLDEYNKLSRSSATSSIDAMLTDTYTTIKEVTQSVTAAQNVVTFITASQPDYNTKDATTASANVNSWASQANSDLNSLVSARNSTQSSINSFTVLQNGADSLDIQSSELSLEQAQRSYDNYFIRAPYDGIIGRIPVNVYGQAGGSTVIATIIGNQKIASISLNEVDAAKVKTGQQVNITFDAIDNLNATGTISSVDQIGSVTQGVVSYGVKININTIDSRIKPGMSVNTTIVTKQDDNVLTIPSSAIKTQGNQNYVLVLNSSVLTTNSNATARQGSSTNQFRNQYSGLSSSSPTTTPFIGQNNSGTFRTGSSSNLNKAITVSTASQPQKVFITIGDADDTNTEILTGLSSGQLIVTKMTTNSTQTTTAPSILSSLGGRSGGVSGGGAGANVRVGGGGARIGN